jgi:hypothetical protein
VGPPPIRTSWPSAASGGLERLVAVDLVAGHPGRRCAGVERAGDHRPGQRRLGREPDIGRDTGGPAAIRVRRPRPGQVQGPVDERVPTSCGVDHIDPDLGVLHPPGGAGVLALHPDRGGALLQIPGLVHDQHRVRVGEVVHHIAAQILPHRLGVPRRPRQQVLHPVRSGVTGMLGDRPTVRPRQPGQQTEQERSSPPGAARPGRTAPRSRPSAHRSQTASDRGLRCGPRPPRDHFESTQPKIMERWPPHARDRHAARSRTTAGVLGW